MNYIYMCCVQDHFCIHAKYVCYVMLGTQEKLEYYKSGPS